VTVTVDAFAGEALRGMALTRLRGIVALPPGIRGRARDGFEADRRLLIDLETDAGPPYTLTMAEGELARLMLNYVRHADLTLTYLGTDLDGRCRSRIVDRALDVRLVATRVHDALTGGLDRCASTPDAPRQSVGPPGR
jgi:hypothetical protein